MVAVAAGLRWLKQLPTDVVMMDLQYTPALVEGEKLRASMDMVARISHAAQDAGVNVFRRFDLMKRWVIEDGISIADLVRAEDPNKLHVSDWAANCLTRALFGQIKARLQAEAAA
jgi:hypothetical protein